jgi:hypothetical protein
MHKTPNSIVPALGLADRFPAGRFVQHTQDLAWSFCRRGGGPTGDEDPGKHPCVSTYQEFSREQIHLVASQVALPDGSTPPIDIISLLPPHLATLYQTLDSVADLGRLPVAKSIRVARPEDAGEYASLLVRMQRAGMVRFQSEKPLTINGVFVVPKPDGMQRVIIDCRPANAVCDQPPKVRLPNPGYFVSSQWM